MLVSFAFFKWLLLASLIGVLIFLPFSLQMQDSSVCRQGTSETFWKAGEYLNSEDLKSTGWVRVWWVGEGKIFARCL